MNKLIATILLLVYPTFCFGAITIDATSGSTSGTGTLTSNHLTFSHTATGGTNSLLVCAVNNGSNPARTAGPVTYNSVSLTKLERDVETVKNQYVTEIWYLNNPSAGANTVDATWNTSSAGNDFGVGCTSFTGVDLVNTFGATTTASATCSACGVTVTTTANDVVFGTIASDENTTITQGTGLTLQWKTQGVGSDSSFGVETVLATTTTAIMAWTQTSVATQMAGVSIKPAAATVTAATQNHKFVFQNQMCLLNGKAKYIFQ